MSIIQIATPFNIDIEFEQAEFHKRLLAYLVDFVMMILYLILIFFVFSFKVSIMSFDSGEVGFWLLVIMLPLLLYTFTTELFLNGQTLGKKLLKIKVVSLDGGEATLGQYLLRWFARFYEWGTFILLFFWGHPGGYLVFIIGSLVCIVFIAVTPKNQRIGDLLAGTVVVNTRTNLSIYDTVFMHVQAKDYKVMFPEVMRLSDRDINTIKGVLTQAHKHNNFEMCNRVAYKVKDVLKLQTDLYPVQILEKLLEDYNYLATKE